MLPVLTDTHRRIAGTLERFKGGRLREVLTLGAVGTFVTGWLLPRLADIHALHPFVDLRLLTNNNRVDLAGEGLDCHSLLVPDSHQVTELGGMATVRPSIAVGDAPCNSHYVITAGEVEWLRAFDPATSKAVMRMQIARHVQGDPTRLSFLRRVLLALARTWTWLTSFGRSR